MYTLRPGTKYHNICRVYISFIVQSVRECQRRRLSNSNLNQSNIVDLLLDFVYLPLGSEPNHLRSVCASVHLGALR